MKWQNILYGVFAIALMTAGTFWFLENFELQTVDETTGYKGEARSNNLFAARLFLKRMGIPAERREGLPDMPDTDTVILLNTERFSLSKDKTQELLEWVKRGGHLITRARVDLENQNDAESEDWNEMSSTEDRDALQQALGITIGGHQMPDDDELPLILQLEGVDEALNVQLDFFNELIVDEAADTSAITEYQTDNITWLLQQPYGEGQVTLAATLDFFENHNLDEADHGKLLWYLLNSQDKKAEKVWLVHQDTLPSLIVLLIRHAGPLLIVLTLLLLFIFWNRIPRFGAMVPEPPPSRRRILDHIHASGLFLWKHQKNGPKQLTQAVRQNLNLSLKQKIPGWGFMNKQQQQEALAKYSQWPEQDQAKLNHLLSAEQLEEQDFIRLVQLARQLKERT